VADSWQTETQTLITLVAIVNHNMTDNNFTEYLDFVVSLILSETINPYLLKHNILYI